MKLKTLVLTCHTDNFIILFIAKICWKQVLFSNFLCGKNKKMRIKFIMMTDFEDVDMNKEL